MAVDIHSPTEPGFAGLLKGIITDVGELIRQELRFARTEFRSDLRKTREAVIYFGTGAVHVMLGVLLLGFMFVHLLYWAVSTTAESAHIPLWGCYGIVSAVFLVIGAV